MAQQAKPVTPIKTAPAPKAQSSQTPVHFIFDKGNYKVFIIAIAVVALGFFLMAGTTDIYSDMKIVIAPLVVLTGFGIGFYAILRKPATKA